MKKRVKEGCTGKTVRGVSGWFVLMRYGWAEFKPCKMRRTNASPTDFNSGPHLIVITSWGWREIASLLWPIWEAWWMAPYIRLPCMEEHKYTERSPPNTEAHVQVLKTTNQPVPRNSRSFRCAGTEQLQKCSKSNGPGYKTNSSSLLPEVSRNHPAQ